MLHRLQRRPVYKSLQLVLPRHRPFCGSRSQGINSVLPSTPQKFVAAIGGLSLPSHFPPSGHAKQACQTTTRNPPFACWEAWRAPAETQAQSGLEPGSQRVRMLLRVLPQSRGTDLSCCHRVSAVAGGVVACTERHCHRSSEKQAHMCAHTAIWKHANRSVAA